MKVLYFTGTGNSLYVAKRLGGEQISIAQAEKMKNYTYEDDVVGFVYPCYALGTPRIMREFLKKITVKAEYTFAVMTFGGEAAGGTLQFREFAAAAGIHLDYTNEIRLVDNMKVVDDYDEEIVKDRSPETEAQLDQMAKDIADRVRQQVQKPEELIQLTGRAYPTLGDQLDHADEKYIIQEGCTQCKLCENVCPVGNITVTDHPEFLHHCEACHACLHICPNHVIVFPAYHGDGRYINSHIKKKELIAANKVK